MNAETQKEFEELAKPLIKFINDKCNPHTRIIVDPTGAEVVSGEASIYTQEFLRD